MASLEKRPAIKKRKLIDEETLALRPRALEGREKDLMLLHADEISGAIAEIGADIISDSTEPERIVAMFEKLERLPEHKVISNIQAAAGDIDYSTLEEDFQARFAALTDRRVITDESMEARMARLQGVDVGMYRAVASIEHSTLVAKNETVAELNTVAGNLLSSLTHRLNMHGERSSEQTELMHDTKAIVSALTAENRALREDTRRMNQQMAALLAMQQQSQLQSQQTSLILQQILAQQSVTKSSVFQSIKSAAVTGVKTAVVESVKTPFRVMYFFGKQPFSLYFEGGNIIFGFFRQIFAVLFFLFMTYYFWCELITGVSENHKAVATVVPILGKWTTKLYDSIGLPLLQRMGSKLTSGTTTTFGTFIPELASDFWTLSVYLFKLIQCKLLSSWFCPEAPSFLIGQRFGIYGLPDGSAKKRSRRPNKPTKSRRKSPGKKAARRTSRVRSSRKPKSTRRLRSRR